VEKREEVVFFYFLPNTTREICGGRQEGTGIVGGGEGGERARQRPGGAARHAARVQVRARAVPHLAHARYVHVHPLAAHEVL
jgi:hypothetical protein